MLHCNSYAKSTFIHTRNGGPLTPHSSNHTQPFRTPPITAVQRCHSTQVFSGMHEKKIFSINLNASKELFVNSSKASKKFWQKNIHF